MSANDDRFKQQLGPALNLWVSEDLISQEQATRLRAYYALDELSAVAHSRFSAVLLGFGAVLLGLGLISFVAANWELIPRMARVLAGLAIMIGLDLQGYRWWLRPETHRRGAAALLVAALMLGGNIALMAQWFQIGGSGWGLFLAWALGSLAMAGALRFGLVGALACLCTLAVMGGMAEDLHGAYNWVFPWVFAGLFLPLTVWCDSMLLLAATLFCLIASTCVVASDMDLIGITSVITLGALAMWSWAGWQESRLPAGALPGAPVRPGRPDQDALRNAVATRTVGFLILLLTLHVWGFKDMWRQEAFRSNVLAMPTLNLVTLAAFALVAVGTWVWTMPKQQDKLAHWGLGGIAGLFLVMVGCAFHANLVIPENALLVVAELGLAWLGLARAARGIFWVGLGGLTLQVFARFMEYDTDLTAKSAVFMLWGVMLLVLGNWFERQLRRNATQGGAA